MKFGNNPRALKASALIETIFGIGFLVPVILSVIDLGIIYLGANSNNSACIEIAKSLAAEGPSNGSQLGREKTADSLLPRFIPQNQFFTVRPHCLVSPNSSSALEVSTVAMVTVETVVDVHPPFLLSFATGNRGVTLKAVHSEPITGVDVVKGAKPRFELSEDAWQVTIAINPLPHLLENVDSTLKPFAKASVTFANENGEPEEYEDLYYGDQHPLGSLKKSTLKIRDGREGRIHIAEFYQNKATRTEADNASFAAVDATIRVLIEAATKRCIIKEIVVSEQDLLQIIAAFERLGFRVINSPSDLPLSYSLLLRIISEGGTVSNIAY